MVIIETLREHRRTASGIGFATIVLVVLLVQNFRSQPQIGSNEDVAKTVDALFTSLTSKDLKRLHECEVRLKEYREQGVLPHSAANSLTSIIESAKSRHWGDSAQRLYDFILAQRRSS